MTDILATPPQASSLLAFVTTVHLGLAALRNHRRESGAAGLALAAVSLALAATPWILPSAIGLSIGLAVHVGWFGLCEWLAPHGPVRPAASREVPGALAVPPAPSRPRHAPRAWVQARVLAVVQETPEIRTFRLARPEGFDFVSGQFLTVRLQVDGREHARCYSISSAPEMAGYIEISVRRQGLVSGALHATVRPGTTLAVMPPLGSFVYPSGDDRPLVLLAGGVGITPLVSMLRHAVAAEPSRPVTLLYGARSDEEFAFRDELLALARRHPQVRVHFASSATGDPAVYPGRIDEALVRATVPDLAVSIVCLCGPGPMIEALRGTLAGCGVPASHVRFERFEAAVAASEGGAAQAEPRAAQAHQAGAAFRLSCVESGRTVPIAAGQTLLEAAEQARIELASLCRAGICGTCRVQVMDGTVRCDAASLDADERAQGYVLACVSTVESDCSLRV